MKLCSELLKKCLNYSSEAYERHSIENKKTDTQVILHKEHNTLYIAFGGTKTVKDVMTDIKRSQTKFKQGKGEVHRGFKAAYDSVAEEVKEEVRREGIKEIILTGHSLGGALAQLCAFDLSISQPSIQARVITFGAPRVGDRYFVESYKKLNIDTYLIEHTLDPVTMTPFFGYKKVAKPINHHRWTPSWHTLSSYSKTLT